MSARSVKDPAPAGRPRRDGRHRGREAALQILYQWEVGRTPIEEAVETFWSLQPPGGVAEKVRSFAAALARGVVEHVAEIDPLIATSAEHWRLSRMAIVDRLVMRLAVYEFLHTPDTPPKVVINEALELARTFSTEDAVRFINGLLDAIRKKLTT